MTELYPEKVWTKNGLNFHLINRDRDGNPTAVAKPVEFNAVTEAAAGPTEPTLFLRTDQVQILIDRLWDLGFRPSEGTGSAGSLKQAENHIESLRKIAYALLPK